MPTLENLATIEQVRVPTHLNPASRTPPVDCQLLIELPSGQLVQVERREWARSHSDALTFYLPNGSMIAGRFRWTYP